jgi:hypothetical protein
MKQDTNTDEQIQDAGHDEDTIPQVRALCSHLECLPEELSLKRHDHYGLAVYAYGRREFAIGDDDEADEAVRDNIKDSVWSFRPEFLSSYTGLPEEVFTALQVQCEDSNDAVLQCIKRTKRRLAGFVDEAVAADGRGHFLSPYDGDEHEVDNFYIYQI